MKTHNVKFFSAMILALFLLATFATLSPHQNQGTASPNALGNYRVPIVISNNLSVASPAPYDEMVMVNSSLYSQVESKTLSNIYFSYGNGTIIYSWLQSGNTSNSTNTTYWLKLNWSISADTSITVYMNIEPLGDLAFNTVTTGEAPQFTSYYGQFDNGKHVFNLYDNFANDSLNASLWNFGGSITVNNGLSSDVTLSEASYITSKVQFTFPSYVEAYGMIKGSYQTGSTSYFLDGVGFGNGGIPGAPVITTGWAQQNVNGIGLTVYNGSGSQMSNFSKSTNPNEYHVFGTGFINGTHTTGLLDGVVQNSSSVNLVLPSPYTMNITLGYQSGNVPTSFSFYWIFERNSTVNGMADFPYTVGNSQVNETFQPVDLPGNIAWNLTINGHTYQTPGGPISVVLSPGTYTYSYASENSSFEATTPTGQVTVSTVKTYNLQFSELYNLTLMPDKLPNGVSWSATTNGVTKTSHQSNITFALPNGTYQVEMSAASGYLAYPGKVTIDISGSATGGLIMFESPQNQSLIRVENTYGPNFKTITPGYSINTTDTFYGQTYSSSLDLKNNALYTADIGNNALSYYLLGAGISSTKSYPSPSSVYYDPVSAKLYAVSYSTNNFTVIDPNTLDNISNTHLTNLAHLEFSAIVPGYNDSTLYVVSSTGNANAVVTISVMGTNGTLMKWVNYTDVNLTYFDFSLYAPAYYHGLVLMANTSGLLVMNPETGTMHEYSTPKGYVAATAVQYGTGGNFIIGNANGSSDLMFNTTTDSFVHGPDINGMVYSGAYDTQSNLEYIQWGQLFNVGYENISAFNPITNSIVVTSPYVSFALNTEINPNTQMLYTLEYPQYVGSGVVSYSIAKAETVQFNENGLPSGAGWYVNVTGEGQSGSLSSGTSYTLSLINGTYSYSISDTNKNYKADGGVVTVKGSSVTVDIQFSPVTYLVNFTESGLSSNTLWTVVINGTYYYNQTADHISLDLMNGTYTYRIVNLSGYNVMNQTGTIDVNGHNAALHVTFTRLKSASSFSNLYYIIGGVVAAVVVAGSAALIFSRRKIGK